MAFDTSDRFKQISIAFGNSGIAGSIAYLTTDGDRSNFDIEDQFNYETGEVNADSDLDILQQIYGNGGFLDADGNARNIEFRGLDFVTSIEDLEKYDLWNPFDAESYNRWRKSQQISGYGTRGLQTPKVVNGREILESQVDQEAVKGHPTSETYDYPLSRWFVYQRATNEFGMRLNIPQSDEVSTSDQELDAYPEILALLKWLENKKTAGSDVGTEMQTGTQRTTSIGGTRTFGVRQVSTDTNDLVFSYGDSGETKSNNQFLVIDLHFTRESGAGIEITDLASLLYDETVSLNATDITLTPTIGGKSGIIKAFRMEAGDRAIEMIHDTILYNGKHVHGNKRYTSVVGPGWGVPLDYSELSIQNNIRYIPFRPMQNEVHIKGLTADTVVVIPNPRQLCFYPGTTRIIAIHNIDSTYNVEVRHWDSSDNIIIILKPGEHFEFRITLDDSGLSGRLIDEHLPERKYQYLYGAGADQYAPSFMAGYWDAGSVDFRLIPENSSLSDATLDYDTDAFTRLTETQPTDDQDDIDDVTIADFDYSGVVEIKLSGILDFSYFTRLITDADATGTISIVNALRLYKFPADGSNPVQLIEDKSDSWGRCIWRSDL